MESFSFFGQYQVNDKIELRKSADKILAKGVSREKRKHSQKNLPLNQYCCLIKLKDEVTMFVKAIFLTFTRHTFATPNTFYAFRPALKLFEELTKLNQQKNI